jgi:hypothetical protein
MPTDFATFFAQATGKPAPHDYQKRLACGERPEGEPEADWQSGFCMARGPIQIMQQFLGGEW